MTSLTLLAGSANRPLAEATGHALGTTLGRCTVERFPDGELQVAIEESVRGHDVYLVQPTSPLVETHLLELLLLADACRRAGAARLTTLIPYFGYARQDRRATGREPVSARLIADLIGTSGVHRVVAVDLHARALEGFFPVPLEHLSAVPLLAAAVRPSVRPDTVVVAPDLGAIKLAEQYGHLLQLPVAFVHKTRVSGTEVRVSGITGDVRDRPPLIVDDMISTGGTIEAAIRTLMDAGCVPEVAVVASHALLVGPAVDRLQAVPVRRLIVTDSVETPTGLPLPLQRVSLGPLLADIVARLHDDRSLADLIAHQ